MKITITTQDVDPKLRSYDRVLEGAFKDSPLFHAFAINDTVDMIVTLEQAEALLDIAATIIGRFREHAVAEAHAERLIEDEAAAIEEAAADLMTEVAADLAADAA